MTRPRQEIRVLLTKTLPRLAAEVGPVSVDQVVVATGVCRDLCVATLQDMIKAGQVIRSGKEKPAGSTRWHTLYEPADVGPVPAPSDGMDALTVVMRQFPATPKA